MYSLDPVYQLLSTKATIHANLYLAHAIGMTETIIFNVLVAKSTWYINNNMSDDGWFYCTQNDLQASTTFGIKTQRSAIKHLVEKRLIEYKVAGVPQKRYFRIVNDNSILSVLLTKGMEEYNSLNEEKNSENADNSKKSQTDELKSPNGLIKKSQTDELKSPNGTNYSVQNGLTNQSEWDYKNNINKKEIKKESKENIYYVPQTSEKTVSDENNKAVYEEIISYLNQKAGTSYRATGSDTKKHINARLSEGYSIEDFKTVIDKKCNEWLGTTMQQYLRPSTLFGTKFESYLNAPDFKTNKTTDLPSGKPKTMEEILKAKLGGQENGRI